MSIRPPHHYPIKESRNKEKRNESIVINDNNKKRDYNEYFSNDIKELLSLIYNSNISSEKKEQYLSCINQIVTSYKKRSDDITDSKESQFGINRDIFELYKSYIPIICVVKFYLKMDIGNIQKKKEFNKKIVELEESIQSFSKLS